MPFSTTLLIAIDRFNRGIDTDIDSIMVQTTKLPEPFAQNAHDFQKGAGLVQSQAVNIAPEGGGHRKSRQSKKTANYGIKLYVSKMPNSIKAYK